MIPARKSARLSRLFAGHVARRMRRRFSVVRVRGLEACADLARKSPVLFVANHSSWWDPMAAILLSHRLLMQDGFALMDAANLRRRPVFSRIGAVGVDLGDARSGAAAIRHCARLLDRSGRALWIFPEGRERWFSPGPLAFQAGAAMVARRASRARVVPVGLRYVVAGAELPEAWISIGAPVTEPHPTAQALAVQAELGRIAAAASGSPGPEWAQPLGRRASGPSLAERLLGVLTGGSGRPRALPERA